MPLLSKQINECRSCNSQQLISVLNLGEIALSDFIDKTQDDLPKVPLELVLCTNCQLVQLLHTTEPDLMFRHFHYRSSITNTMRLALNDIVGAVCSRIQLSRGDTVIDIGSNDSYLLTCYSRDLDRIGFEPATNLMDEARRENITVVNDYFTYEHLREVSGKKAKVITAIAMFYDLNDPNGFLRDIKRALSDDGLFVIQMSYLPSMLKFNDISNICHEHLEYYSLTSLEQLLHKNGFYVQDVEKNNINGGSFRLYCKLIHENPLFTTSYLSEDCTQAVKQMRFEEKALGLNTSAPYEAFGQRAQVLRGHVRAFVIKEKSLGKSVYLYGASTKANTLLQYWGLDSNFIDGAADRDSRKWGKVTSGGRIPIVSEDEARQHASSFLVGPFFFKEEFIKREADFLKTRTMVFPLPQFEIVGNINNA